MEIKKKKTVVFAPVLEETQKIVRDTVNKVDIDMVGDAILLLNPKYEHLYNELPEYLED